MATYGEEPVDRYFYSSYNPYMGRYSRPRDAGWKYKGYFSHYGDTSDAFNNHQRAQLKSILSQINPKLTPRLRKANTKDVAVQVNPKKDASVQCSIGPRTLQAMKRDFQRRRRQEPATPSSPKATGGVRYPRTLAVYSPIAYRSVTSFLVDDNNKDASSEAVPTVEPHGDPGEGTEGKEDESKAGQDGKTARSPEQNQKLKPQMKSELAPPVAEESKTKARVRFQSLTDLQVELHEAGARLRQVPAGPHHRQAACLAQCLVTEVDVQEGLNCVVLLVAEDVIRPQRPNNKRKRE
ncbi:Zygote arrest protein 1 [Goodea atripinnis]|uniref:Zygote arrest protein 1 n=1 Tax=Goodea atripinnis TaxID=208336 RepID=A0ABV0MEC6_9TELE